MPKILTMSQLNKIREEERAKITSVENVTNIINEYMNDKKIRKKDLAVKLGVSTTYINKRIKNPLMFQIGELIEIYNFLGVATDEMIFRNNELTYGDR